MNHELNYNRKLKPYARRIDDVVEKISYAAESLEEYNKIAPELPLVTTVLKRGGETFFNTETQRPPSFTEN